MGRSDDNFFKNFILGVTNECLTIDNRKQNKDAVLKLIASAQHDVVIVSRYLDPTVFNNEDIFQAASELIRKDRSSSVRILVHDTSSIVKNGHRVLELSQRISSKIEIRTICDEYSQLNQSFVVADTKGYIFNQKSDRYDAEVNFFDTDKSKELEETFERIWEQSMQDTVMRRLCI